LSDIAIYRQFAAKCEVEPKLCSGKTLALVVEKSALAKVCAFSSPKPV
jgi:hypothetical protein